MRKVIAILFTFFLLFNLAGYYLFYQLRMHEVKVAMKEALRSNKHGEKAVSFLFTSAQAKALEWEGDHEFSYNGEMYDVIDRHDSANHLIIQCIPDKAEMELLQAYAKSYKGTQKQDKNTTIALIKLVANFYVPVEEVVIEKLTSTQHFEFPFIQSPLPFQTRNIITPPPQLV